MLPSHTSCMAVCVLGGLLDLVVIAIVLSLNDAGQRVLPQAVIHISLVHYFDRYVSFMGPCMCAYMSIMCVCLCVCVGRTRVCD
jgi:hypothetical protein